MKQIILISNPTPVANEGQLINELFIEGLEVLHLRKPGYDIGSLGELVAAILPEYHSRIVWPATFLQDEYWKSRMGKRIHFFEFLRTQIEPETFRELKNQGFVLSTSVHEAAAYNALARAFDYTFFSPVFDSISKPGYTAMPVAKLELLKQRHSTKIIALGGIQEENCRQALDYGFDGVAILGAVWQSAHPVATFKNIQACIMSGQS